MGFDEVVFEQQRLGLGIRHRDFDGGDLLHERLHLGIDVAGGEIGADAISQALRLADVQQLVLGTEHAVHAGALRERCRVFLMIECLGVGVHGLSPANSQARATTFLNMGPVSTPVDVL